MDKVKVFYYKDVPNFGDMINPLIFERLFHLDCVYASKYTSDIVAIGSMLDPLLIRPWGIFKRLRASLNPSLLVWGTGFIREGGQSEVLSRDLSVYAVRGKNTFNRLRTEKKVNLMDDVVLGDPGLLLPYVVDVPKTKSYKLGIIPHYSDKDNSLFKNLSMKNTILLDVAEPPEELFRKISACEMIISSAMHGLIAADSLGIPNIRMIVGKNISGGDYKYNDYYSALDIDTHSKVYIRSLEELGQVEDIIDANYSVSYSKVTEIQKKLFDSVNKVKDELLGRLN